MSKTLNKSSLKQSSYKRNHKAKTYSFDLLIGYHLMTFHFNSGLCTNKIENGCNALTETFHTQHDHTLVLAVIRSSYRFTCFNAPIILTIYEVFLLKCCGAVTTTTQGLRFKPYPRHIVAFLDKAVFDVCLCLVEH